MEIDEIKKILWITGLKNARQKIGAIAMAPTGLIIYCGRLTFFSIITVFKPDILKNNKAVDVVSEKLGKILTLTCTTEIGLSNHLRMRAP